MITRQDMDLVHIIIIVFILWILSVGSAFWVPYNHLLLGVILALILVRTVPPVNSAHELGWTLETLRVHLEAAIRATATHMEERIKSVADTAQAAAQNADKAVSKAETAAEKRFESVNEFRNTLSDQQRNLMPRDEANIRFEALTHEIRGAQHILENMRAEQKGVVGGWGYAIGVVGLVLTLVTLGILVMQSVKMP